MSKKMKKFLDVNVKAAEDGSGAFWFTASTDSRDRQGDVIVQNGWKTADFMKNPVILWAHNYYETPIGKAVEMKMTGDSISVKIKFASEIDPFADKVEKLVAGGYLKTVSVGFMVYKSEPLTTEDLAQRPEMKYGQRLYGDLLEVSVVPVPANPEALNENAFAEVVSRGWGLKPDEAKSKFLPYLDAKGAVAPRLLRASIAAALGARGGITPNDADPTSCLNHLIRIAKENNVEYPNVVELQKIQTFEGSEKSVFLKETFKDVWHEELLEVLNQAQSDEETVLYKLVKGNKRKEIEKARDALNLILSMSETEESKSEPVMDEDVVGMVKDITKNLSDITARLK